MARLPRLYDAYFLTVSRYIELNPVRVKMVASQSEYVLSSYRGNAMGKEIESLGRGSDRKSKRVKDREV